MNSHARSISLPSRSNPKVVQIQQLLFSLKPVDDAASLSLSETSTKIGGLRDLLENFDEFLLLPQTRQALCRGCNEKWVDELLDGLVSLLDVCGIAKDVSSRSKQHIQGLRSMFRRRKSYDLEVAKEIIDYLASRKNAKKLIHKGLKDVKTKCRSDKGDNTMDMADMSRRIQQVVLTTLKSLLFYISGSKTRSKVRSWNLVSNLMRSKQVERSEIEKVDAAISNILLEHKAKKCSDPRFQNLQTELGKLELIFEDLEHELECLHRDLIKARVTLLNILNH